MLVLFSRYVCHFGRKQEFVLAMKEGLTSKDRKIEERRFVFFRCGAFTKLYAHLKYKSDKYIEYTAKYITKFVEFEVYIIAMS